MKSDWSSICLRDNYASSMRKYWKSYLKWHCFAHNQIPRNEIPTKSHYLKLKLSFLIAEFAITAGAFTYAYVKDTIILCIGRLLASIGCSIFLLSAPLLVSKSFSFVLAYSRFLYQTRQFLSQGLSSVSSILHKKKKNPLITICIFNNMFVLFCLFILFFIYFFFFQMGRQLLVLSIVAPAFLQSHNNFLH